MSTTHATPSTVGNPAAAHIPTAGDWDAALIGTNDHGHTATADGGLIAPLTQAVTATADGLTEGIITAKGFVSYVDVTSANAAHIVALPAPVPGTIVILANGGTGYELRSSAPATIAINGGAEANAESAIAANTLVIAVCKTATAWAAFSLAGTTLAAVEAAAAA